MKNQRRNTTATNENEMETTATAPVTATVKAKGGNKKKASAPKANAKATTTTANKEKKKKNKNITTAAAAAGTDDYESLPRVPRKTDRIKVWWLFLWRAESPWETLPSYGCCCKIGKDSKSRQRKCNAILVHVR